MAPWLLMSLAIAKSAIASPSHYPSTPPTETIAGQLDHCYRVGGTASCYQLGEAFTSGRDSSGNVIGVNLACAYEHFSALCTDPHRFGCGPMGRALVLGAGVARDVARGRTLLESQCKMDENCLELAELYQSGALAPATRSVGRKVAFAACKQGAREACDYLESLLDRCSSRERGARCEHTRTVDACARGVLAKCRVLGEAYARGTANVPANQYKAMDHFGHACDGGDRRACAGLGDLLFREHANWDTARPYWKRACDAGDQVACHKTQVRPDHPRDRVEP